MKDRTASSADESRVRDYLAGRLDEAEAERFEQRMFEDDALAAEVQRALEIRAATPAQTSATRRPVGPPRRALYVFAVAATAAVLAVGIVWLQQPPAPVFRGVEQRLRLEVDLLDGGILRARWQPIADAAGYELQLLASDGRVLRSLETEMTAATIDVAAPDNATAAFVELSALDDVGQTLQRSGRVAVPGR